MATRSGCSMMRDQNVTGVAFMGKANTFKGLPKEARRGGRTPLGDLSNVEKPAECQALKQLGSKNSNLIKEETIPTKVTKDTIGNRTVKALDKLQTSGRKALSDISNSGKAYGQGLTNKLCVKVNGTKEEEPHELDAIAEEQFLHDHHECVKEKFKPMDIGQFLETIGLDKDMFLHGASPPVVAASSKLQPEDLLEHLDMKDMEEQLCEVQCPSTECNLINSSLPCSPSSSPISMLKSSDVNFKLAEYEI